MTKLEEIYRKYQLSKVDYTDYSWLINRVKKLEAAHQEQVSFDVGDSCACCKESARIARKALEEE